MSSDTDSSPGPDGFTLTLLKRDGWPVAGIVVVTVAVQLGVFLLPQAYGAPLRATIPASLIIAGVWVALASAIFAAGPRSTISGILRGGSVADATAVLLVVLWLNAPEVSFLAAVKMYCIYASVSLCAIAAARCASSLRFRYFWGVIVGVLLVIVQGGLFWLPGLLQLVPADHKVAIAGMGLRANPLYGVFSAIADKSGFVWHYADVMYRITPLGEDLAVPPVQWYEPMVVHLALAGIFSATWLLRRRRPNLPG
ncbi:MAG: hypothetical protein ISS69_17940 [Phycisphaerae bacterium]|nr:hypothetical protein [Phycisphaerae bacterium]